MAAAASFSSSCAPQLPACLLLPDFQQQSLCSDQGSQAVEGQKNTCLSVATFQRKARGSLCSCWDASAWVFCAILSCISLFFHVLSNFFPLGIVSIISFDTILLMSLLPLHNVPPCSRFSEVCPALATTFHFAERADHLFFLCHILSSY